MRHRRRRNQDHHDKSVAVNHAIYQNNLTSGGNEQRNRAQIQNQSQSRSANSVSPGAQGRQLIDDQFQIMAQLKQQRNSTNFSVFNRNKVPGTITSNPILVSQSESITPNILQTSQSQYLPKNDNSVPVKGLGEGLAAPNQLLDQELPMQMVQGPSVNRQAAISEAKEESQCLNGMACLRENPRDETKFSTPNNDNGRTKILPDTKMLSPGSTQN